MVKIIDIKQWAEVLSMLCRLPVDYVRRILLFGPPGTGKTTFALSQSEQAERITLTQGMFPDALLGKFLLKDGSTHWVNAAMTRAALHGCPLVIDEIHKGGGELDSTLQAGLDDKAVCRLNLDNGETIVPADGYRVIATMNGSPDQLNEAVLDRFDVVLRCGTPHPGILKRLTPGASAFILNKMQNEPDNDQYVPKISPRRLLSFEMLQAGIKAMSLEAQFPDTLAADLVFGEGQGRAILTGMIDAARNSIETK